MQTILLICDDERRRAELHRQLLPDFEVYAVSHKKAARLRRKMARKKVIVVEEEEWGAAKKISIHPLTDEEGGKLSRLIGSIVEVMRVGRVVTTLLFTLPGRRRSTNTNVGSTQRKPFSHHANQKLGRKEWKKGVCPHTRCLHMAVPSPS